MRSFRFKMMVMWSAVPWFWGVDEVGCRVGEDDGGRWKLMGLDTGEVAGVGDDRGWWGGAVGKMMGWGLRIG